MNNLIVPTDFSLASKRAFEMALALRHYLDANVKVVHFYPGTFILDQPIALDPQRIEYRTLGLKMQEFTNSVLPGELLEPYKPSIEFKEGDVETELIHLSKAADTEMIIMATTGPKGLSGKFFGTLSTNVARFSHCPVVLLPEQSREFKGFENIVFATDYLSIEKPLLFRMLAFAERFGAAVHFVHVLKENDNFKEIETTILDALFEDEEPQIAFTMTPVMADSVAEGLNGYAVENGIDLVVMVAQGRLFFESIFHKSTTREMAFATTTPLMVWHDIDNMETLVNKTQPRKKKVKPLDFEVIKAVVGIERGATDEKLLDYLEFFDESCPIGSFDFVHFHKELRLFSQIQRGMAIENGPVNYIGQVVDDLKRTVGECAPKLAQKEADFLVRRGDPLEGVLKEAAFVKADLLVIGQKANTDHHTILDKNLVRKSVCNVLVIPENAAAKMDHILVPFDFSDFSVRAVRKAVALVKKHKKGTKITLLNVYEFPLFGNRFPMANSEEKYATLIRNDRERAFQEFMDEHFDDVKDWLQTQLIELDSNNPANGIIEYANANDVDLIIMGTKGHSTFDRLLMGSVTEKTLALNDHIPILVVK